MRRKTPTLEVGSPAPAFTLLDQKGEPHTLDQYLQHGHLLLAFHRGTWCPNCRRRFGELAVNSPTYLAHGARVAAIVAQRSEKVKRYIEETGLPFHTLIDDTREVMKAYGVWHHLGWDAYNIAYPSLFVIDREGFVRAIFVGDKQTEFPDHEAIMKELDGLEGAFEQSGA